MRITRVYTGDDDQSHFETIDVPLGKSRYGSLSELFEAEGVIFRETPAGGELDFHNAPRRQFVVTLSGEVEIECGDGATRRLGASAPAKSCWPTTPPARATSRAISRARGAACSFRCRKIST